MTVPTPLIVLAGLLLVALILRLLQVLGTLLEPLRQLFASEGVQLDRQKLLTVVMVSAAKHRIATPTELKAAFDLLPP